ncbi:MAG: hypothetical protein ACOX5R_16860 [bacterium]
MIRFMNVVGIIMVFVMVFLVASYVSYGLDPGYVGPNLLCKYHNTTEIPIVFFWTARLNQSTCQSFAQHRGWFETATTYFLQILEQETAYNPVGWFEDPWHGLHWDTSGNCVKFSVVAYALLHNLHDPVTNSQEEMANHTWLYNYPYSRNTEWRVAYVTDLGIRNGILLQGSTFGPYKSTMLDFFNAYGVHTALHEYGHTFHFVNAINNEYVFTDPAHCDGYHYPDGHAHSPNNIIKQNSQTMSIPDPDDNFKRIYESKVFFND